VREQLEKFLEEIKKYNLDDYTVAVFGAGNTSVLYQKCFEQEGINPAYYIDNNKTKQDTVFYNVPVISVEKLISLKQTFSKPILVFICSANVSMCCQIKQQLSENNLLYCTVDEFVFNKNRDKILKVYDVFEDDYSRDVYEQILYSRILSIPIDDKIITDVSYFCLPQFRDLSMQEIFVDLGAFTGDTIEYYIWKRQGSFFKSIYAFEPDKRNFNAMNNRVTRLKNEWCIPDDKFLLVNAGVGAKTEYKQFTSTSSSLGANFITDNTKGAEEIIVYALNDYFREQRISFIKADIESYELDMLHGAEAVIKRDKPLLALSIYHNASDIYTIPLFVKKLYQDYKLKIRHHTTVYADTVLYAYL
jgi:FkbM family methyltransferase